MIVVKSLLAYGDGFFQYWLTGHDVSCSPDYTQYITFSNWFNYNLLLGRDNGVGIALIILMISGSVVIQLLTVSSLNLTYPV